MRPLDAAELLAVWEQTCTRPPVERALALVAAASPETPADELAALPIGRRDAALLRLRSWTFGPEITATMECPACGEMVELTTSVPELLVPEAAGAPALGEGAAPIEVAVAGSSLTLRLPDSRDLAALPAAGSVDELRQALLSRLVLDGRAKGRRLEVERLGPRGFDLGQLPPELVEAAMARLAEADPQADVELALACPGCGHGWLAGFDITTFFWREIEAWALRTLREVHVLASAYGWAEREILALSAWRRSAYLQLVGA
ncbi:MAG TPA: phage baseplate protein [Thermoanaerobaculia bacterium]|nr:phage baseplate protein [Thermoanaerobaculia bacterium]